MVEIYLVMAIYLATQTRPPNDKQLSNANEGSKLHSRFTTNQVLELKR